MSAFSTRKRSLFLSRFALAMESVEQRYADHDLVMRFGHPDCQVEKSGCRYLHVGILCPITLTCLHAIGDQYALYEYREAAEAMAMPRGMATVLALAADGGHRSPWKQRGVDWWKTALQDCLPGHEPSGSDCLPSAAPTKVTPTTPPTPTTPHRTVLES